MDIQKIAQLAKLRLTSAEEKTFGDQLSGILEHVSALDKAPTQGILPTSQSTGLVGKERKDVLQNTPLQQQQKDLINCSRYREDNFIKLPPVL